LSAEMKKLLATQVWESVLYVEDKFCDPTFNRQAARTLGLVMGPDLAIAMPEMRPQVEQTARSPAAAKPPPATKASSRSGPSEQRGRKRKYEGFFPVDDVNFSQNSIGERFSCGRRMQDTVEDLMDDQVNPERDQFLRLTAMSVGGRLISRNNRRLWCLKEYQKLKRQRKKSFTVKVFLYVTEVKDRGIEDFIQARTCERGGPADGVPEESDGESLSAASP
ncbi:unnamed protein product, partial [Symbiodinium pilosum]